MTILQFLRPRHDDTFDHAATQVMGEAYDWVCAGLSLDDPNREAVARRIIEAAQGGERDPVSLRGIGLAAMRP